MLLARPLFSGQNEFEILTNIYEANLNVLDRHAQDIPAPLQKTLRQALSREPSRRSKMPLLSPRSCARVSREIDLSLGHADVVPWLSAPRYFALT